MKSRSALLALACIHLAGCMMGPAVSKSRDGNLEINRFNSTGDADLRVARVFVDEVFVGNLSRNLPVLHLRRGPRAVRVELPGFKPWQQTVHILGDPNHQVLNAVMEKQ